MRAFIAVDIPHEIQQAIHQATTNFRQAVGAFIRWVPTENLHLTLKFLGDVSPASVDLLTQMLRVEAGSAHCFDMHLGGLGSFPSLRRPRVIYIGIQAPGGLEALQHGVESASRRLGYEADERAFSPHLTIGRVRQDVSPSDQQKVRQALERFHIDSLGTARVDSVHLYKSDLKPSGSVYTKLFSAPLQPVIAGSRETATK
ncbi:MAG: RNA 2',3'-cyclic phosphodiesterase [Chloroflexi bacterium]|nr:RNA 2',3'-cyclic phosphodiesterase [Chloroflexota bacterium]